MAKIYTKKGDRGKTSLGNGEKVWKDDQRVKTYGVIDELNSLIGIVISLIKQRHSGKSSGRGFWTSQNDEINITASLQQIQSDLMIISSILAGVTVETCHGTSLQSRTKFLENRIDEMEKDLPSLNNFILPGGSLAGSIIHYTRTVCRRAEREVVTLSRKEKILPEILIYLNRLSDCLFVLARYVNRKDKTAETIWKTS